MRKLIYGVVIGGVVGLVFSLVTASQFERTSTVEFCSSCHEMTVFHGTWRDGPHGLIHRGAIRAKCTDCHLPHDGLLHYIRAKIFYGLNDYYAHVTGKKASVKHWLEHWEHKKPYVHKAYVSGCKKCHKEIIGDGIPIKAILAHKAYLIGETKKNCISCHHMVGHGDVLSVLREKSGSL